MFSQNSVAKPSAYFESQVVAHSPQTVFVSEPIQFINTIQPVPLPRQVEVVRQPLETQQIQYVQYSPPPPVMTTQYQQIQ